MADDTKDLIERMRAARGKGAGMAMTRVADPADQDYETSRSNTLGMLRAMGYDEATTQSLVPGATAPTDTMLSDLDGLGARIEADQAANEAPVPLDAKSRNQLVDRFRQLDEHVVRGLATTGKFVNDFARSVGQHVAKHHLSRPVIDAGMAGLDNMAFLSNWAKLQLVPGEVRPTMRQVYLPTETLLDPDSPEFQTTTEMVAWLAGQRAWGAANDLAAMPTEFAGKVLDTLGLPEASAAAYDLARRSRETADQVDQFTAGAVPQLVAAKAPFLSWQDVVESRIPPAELDAIYAQLDDPGSHGPLKAAAAAGLFALADFYLDPIVLTSPIPAKMLGKVPTIAQKTAGGRAAVVDVTSKIARRTHTFDDALSAVNASKVVVADKQALIAKAAKEAGEVPAALYNDLLKAQKAHARNESWLARFQDPGDYEPILLRPARRNPEYVPSTTETQFGLSAGGRSETRTKNIVEIADEVQAARKRALESGADMVVDWNDPNQMTLDLQAQRWEMGPSDAEYAGDAINMLVRGASVDDVSMPGRLDPEYYVLPDVMNGLFDIRKATLANADDRARAALRANPAQHELSPRTMLEHDIATAKTALSAAKAAKNKDGANAVRAHLRQLKKTYRKLSVESEEPFDQAWLPKDPGGIMDSPERFNSWLDAAGDRAVRALYPGALYVQGWHTKLGQTMGFGREPMRYYRTYAPEAWQAIRGGLLRTDAYQKSAAEMLTRKGVDAGVLVPRKGFDPRKHYAPTKVDVDKSEYVARMLDTLVDSDEHKALRAAADPKLVELHDTLRKVYDHMADLQGISGTDRYLSGYFRHMWDRSLFENGARPIEFIGVPAKGNLMVSHMMDRTGAGADYKLDAILVTDMYLRAAYRKLFMEPVYRHISQTGTEIAQRTGNPAHISYANDLINQMKGKPSFLGAKVDDALSGIVNSGGGISLPFTGKKLTYNPGDLDRTIHGLWQTLHTGLTVGPHYAVTQIAAGLATTAGRFGPLATMRGVFRFATKEGQQLGRVAGTYKPFIDYLSSGALTRFTEIMQRKVPSPPLFISNSQSEEAIRSITYNVALKHYMDKAGFKSIKEAADAGYLKRIFFEALQESERINHFYGPLGRTPMVSRAVGSSGATGLTLFLSYIPKQAEEIASQVAKNPGHILQYLAFSGHLTRLAAAAGADMTREVGLGFLPQEPTDITSPAVDAAITNLMLMDALDRHDAEGVERYTTNLVKMLPGLVPGSQTLLKSSKAVDRLQTGTVKTADGKPLYRMQMTTDPDETGIGGELLPTFGLQRSIRESLVRRGLEATRQEEKRVRYNGMKALEAYAIAIEKGDQEAAVKLAEELGNVYRIRLANPAGSAESAVEARSISYTLRNFQGNPSLQDIYWKTYQQHDIPLEP